MKQFLKGIIHSNSFFISLYASFVWTHFLVRKYTLVYNDLLLSRPLFQDGKRILLLIPHFDDEVLGLYGFLKQESNRQKIDIIYLTDGKNCLKSKFIKNITDIRTEESNKALQGISVHRKFYYTLPDGFLHNHQNELEELIQKHLMGNYDFVLTTAPNDNTPDHAILAQATENVVRQFRNTRILYYRSTWCTFPIHDAEYKYVSSIKSKATALMHYRSQNNIPLINTLLYSMHETKSKQAVEGIISYKKYHDNQKKYTIANMLHF
ncbi:MAG: PIG-L family deacetylase [Cyclobacteriaceae bacterium]|nr:PIG-L family deacetylase [Cyclobacteriaceae bacterium]